jgi:hypothetical protein
MEELQPYNGLIGQIGALLDAGRAQADRGMTGNKLFLNHTLLLNLKQMNFVVLN